MLSWSCRLHLAVDGLVVTACGRCRVSGEPALVRQFSQCSTTRATTRTDIDFLSGQSDWTVWSAMSPTERRRGDGIYISNGSDWIFAAFYESRPIRTSRVISRSTRDPASTCNRLGIPFTDPRCDAYAGHRRGRRRAQAATSSSTRTCFSITGWGRARGSITSVRRSIIRNNIIGFYNNSTASGRRRQSEARLERQQDRPQAPSRPVVRPCSSSRAPPATSSSTT